MALSNEPALLIADEPTTALDVTVQAQILYLLEDLQQRLGTAIVIITHDLGVVAEISDNIAVMYAGRIVERGTTEEIFTAPQHPYTWGLLKSIPRLDVPRSDDLVPIAGRPPSLIHRPPGCHFHPRCPYVQEDHKRIDPRLESIDANGGHAVACLLNKDVRERIWGGLVEGRDQQALTRIAATTTSPSANAGRNAPQAQVAQPAEPEATKSETES
jgi:peptide/nickel transport system ATP-binding protein